MTKLIDINPETKHLTEKIQNSSIRIIYEDGSIFNHPINTPFKVNIDGPRSEHPYIKNYINKIDISQNQQILVLNPDGSERYGPIDVPSGKLAIYRMHTRQLKTGGIDVYLKIAIVDKSTQEIHKVRRNGTHEIFNQTSPLKINLMPEELMRL